MAAVSLIHFDHATLRLRDTWLLADTCWRIEPGQHWVMLGPNGAGKTTLAKALLGTVPVVQGRLIRHPSIDGRPDAVAMVSADQYHHIVQRETGINEMRHFAGRPHAQTLAADLIAATRAPQHRPEWYDLLNLSALLKKPVSALSAGEMRRLLIGRALARAPRLLILDEPFNGLDTGARQRLAAIIADLTASPTQLLLITHRAEDMLPAFTHVICLEDSRVRWQGRRSDFHQAPLTFPAAPDRVPAADDRPVPETRINPLPTPPRVQMKAVTVRYGDTVVLDNVDWTVQPGQHWAISGPNGAGKTTLLKLVSGDHLQAYANDIRVLGTARTDGQPIHDLKRHIGMVSADIQARYQKSVPALDVICSGFFDSVGLYRRCNRDQQAAAQKWVHALCIDALADRPFNQLSFGQQRIVLIARAMVKSPRLLILDEPCDGLDAANRGQVRAAVDTACRCNETGLIYVTHRPADLPACITHCLELDRGRVVKRQDISPPGA